MDQGDGIGKLLELKGKALEAAADANRLLLESATLPAAQLYTGVMYGAIDYPTLEPAAKTLFDENTIIVSGLFGAVRPRDHLPNYKLKLSANLGGAIGKLEKYWRQPVSRIIARESKEKIVWDLLPDLHRKAWDGSGEFQERVQVKFAQRVYQDGIAKLKTVSHHSKALKGAFIRHLLTKDPSVPEEVTDFQHPDGYQYSEQFSQTSKGVTVLLFIKE